MSYEIGDNVRNDYPKSKRFGTVGEVVEVNEDFETIEVEYSDGFIGGGKFSSFKNLNGDSTATPRNNNMSIISKLADLFRSEPQKTYRKLGILDTADNLTSEGKELLLNKLFWANEEAMIRPDASKLLEAEKADKKN